jgi:hypothetical protein
MFSAVAPWLERLPEDRFPSCSELNELIGPHVRSGAGVPLRFVEAASAPDEPYETSIYRTGRVPTRAENWHDLLNALVWLSFPHTKALLNRRHCEEMVRLGGESGRRGTARDVLTLFDEGGVIVASSDRSLLELLRRFQWKSLFWDRRADLLERMRFFVFGHAILEKALQPYKGVTAKALLLEVPASFPREPLTEQLAGADSRAARWFSAEDALLSTRNLTPLPVLGVPGWADNETSGFYDDAEVFRPGYRNVRAGR